MTELVHPAGDTGKLAAKRTFEAYVSFSTAVSEVCQILGYEHEIMGSLVQKKNKEEEEIAFVEGQGSMTCKNGSTGQTAHQVACIPRAAWDTPPQPLHAMLGREDVTGGTQGKVQVAKISYKLRDPEDGFPKLQMPAR